jgi:hypothetical protein
MAKKKDNALESAANGTGRAEKNNDVLEALDYVTAKWTRQRRSEQKDTSRVRYRYSTMNARSDRVTFKDAAWKAMAAGYAKASGNGRYPANARQIMYACRGEILRLTKKERLDDKYFTQNLLPRYVREHGLEDTWDVVYDARGHFHEPHTGEEVPLGTLEVREYLKGNRRNLKKTTVDRLDRMFPTHGPQNRYAAILFVEKEGFLPLFEAVKLAERYDLAILSSKGTSVTSARKLIETLCEFYHGIPCFVIRDFDVKGFEIVGTLANSTDRFEYAHDIKVIDWGLRLSDVEEMGLQPEVVGIQGDLGKVRARLAGYGATEEEIDFLLDGQRVELNEMTSEQMVEWVESNLEEHGIKKVVPHPTVLIEAFKHSLRTRLINDRLPELEKEANEKIKEAAIPEDLEAQIRDRLDEEPEKPWDEALAEIIDEQLDQEDDGKQGGEES